MVWHARINTQARGLI